VQASARNDAVVVRVLSRSRSLLPALDRDGYSLAVPLIAHVSDGLVIEHRQGGAGSAIAMRFELAARRGAPGARADACGARFAFPLRRVRDARSAAVGPRSRA
jgi:hypothetical protein